MEATTNPNNTNTFPNILTLHIYKTILLFIVNINFGQKVPAREVLKIASGLRSVEDAKAVCNSCHDRFVGNVGYYKTAVKIVDSLKSKNKGFSELVDKINLLDKDGKLDFINKFVSKNGNSIDLEV